MGEPETSDTSPQGPVQSPQGPVQGPPVPGNGLRAADPANQRRRDVASAGSVLAVMVTSLLLAAAINSASMLQRAESGPLGPARDLSLELWTPIHRASERLGLTGPRRGLDALRNRTADDEPGGLVVAGGPGETGAPADGPAAVGAPPREGSPGMTISGTLSDLAGAGLTPHGPTTNPAGIVPGGGTSTPVATGPLLVPAGPQGATPPPSRPAPTPGAPSGQPPDTGATSTSTSPQGPSLRRPTAAEPLRILVVGDSTMDALGASLLRELEETGVTDAILDYRVSSGLARPDFFDWPTHLRSLRAETGAQLVVIMLGANDAQPFLIDGEPERYGTDRWFDTYRNRVTDLLAQLTADGGGVVWIGLPVMRNDSYDGDLQQLNRIYAEEVARAPRSTYLESRPILSDSGGDYAAYLVDEAGDRQRVRQDDGVHLSEAGGDRLAPAVVEAINTMVPLY